MTGSRGLGRLATSFLLRPSCLYSASFLSPSASSCTNSSLPPFSSVFIFSLVLLLTLWTAYRYPGHQPATLSRFRTHLPPKMSSRPHKQSMSELKLRRLTEHNQRLKEDLARPRVRVSEASARSACSEPPSATVLLTFSAPPRLA